MNKNLILIIVLCAISACVPQRKQSFISTEINKEQGTKTDGHEKSEAIVFEKQSFFLSKTPDVELEEKFQSVLDSSFTTAVYNHSGDNPMAIGFTYSMRLTGAIYPFSEVEVSCIIQRNYSDLGAELCGDFFKSLQTGLKDLKENKDQKTSEVIESTQTTDTTQSE